MQKRRSFYMRLLLIGLILFVADLGIGGLMSHFYFRLRHGEQARTTLVMDSIRAPIVVLGSSRAAHHYIPSIITDSTGLACYNAGKDQQGIFYSLAILRSILGRYRPEWLILDLTPIAFQPDQAGLDELSILLPYYRRHPEIRAVLNKRSRWEWLKTHSSLYCYNSLPLQIVFNNLYGTGDSGVINGYIPKDQPMARTPATAFTERELTDPPDSAIVGAFSEIISLSASNHCKLVVVVSPVYFSLPEGSSTTRLAGMICRDHGVPFLDYSGAGSAGFSGHPALFSDEQHLDHAGAVLFTRQLCTDLRAKGLLTKGTAR
ncbi:MAG: hypothetical protein Q8932_10705 [Bacteroidota bacterium]|nr:hypothetical protein [Bacteroidota bacterium]MDP4246306.1 hypothetical protein [Bacteroidota bacterium]MDP4252427.1 hypothetical protein [Bacteroidota bacterium]MDP4258605.1 hypothetical protein [Bacteroidota bacterium]